MEKIIIFGDGQIAEVAYYYITNDSPNRIVAFTVDSEYLSIKSKFDIPIIPFEDIENHFPPNQFKMFIPISYSSVNKLRAEKYQEAKEKGYHFINYISTKALTWPDLSVGENCFIFENNVIQPFVSIGNNVIIWSGNHIGHHSSIGDHCFISSHVVISGNVKIGPYCFFGVNSTIRDNVNIATECIIGAGALITKDTQESGIYYGPRANVLNQDKKSTDLKRI